MANIKISDLRPVEADLPVISVTGKELSLVSGGDGPASWYSLDPAFNYLEEWDSPSYWGPFIP